MTSTAICLVALFAYLAFDHLVTEVCSVLRARAHRKPCHCQGLPAFTVDHDGEAHPFTPASPEAAARKVH